MVEKPRMRIPSIAAAIVLFLSILPARAMASIAIHHDAPTSQTLLASTFAQLMPYSGPIDLQNEKSRQSLSLPISRRMRIDKAVLHLVATNSISLLTPPSQLRVMLDGRVIAQIPLYPNVPDIQADIAIPVSLLSPGYRNLTFFASLHDEKGCQDSKDSSLWVQINTTKSWIELKGGLKPIHPTLSMFGQVFDAKLWGPAQVDVLMPGGLDPVHLGWSSLAVQAVSLRYKYKPTAIHLTTNIQTDRLSKGELQKIYLNPKTIQAPNAVLIGTQQELAPYLAKGLLSRISGPFLGIYPMDSTNTRFVLIASGKTIDQVSKALESFLYLGFPYLDRQSVIVDSINEPEIGGMDAHDLLLPGQTISFAKLGLSSQTFRFLDHSAVLSFKLPAGIYAPENAVAKMRLNFAYGASFRKDSVLDIFINKKFFRGISLDNEAGGYLTNYRLDIPMSLFKEGINRVRFSPSMVPLVSGNCVSTNTHNLILTLYDSSTITLPRADYITSMPNLSLLGDGLGFPYATGSDGGSFNVILPKVDVDTASSALGIVSKLVQIRGLPLSNVHFYTSLAQLKSRSGNILLVGVANALPSELLKDSPIDFGPHTRAPYVESLSMPSKRQNWFEGIVNNLAHAEPMHVPARQVLAWMTRQGSELGRQGLLMQYESPYDKGDSITVLTAANGTILTARTQELIQPGLWPQLRDNVDTWRNAKTLTAQRVGPDFVIGEASASSRLSYTLSRYPYVLAGVVGILAFLLALVTLRLLVRYRHRHLNDLREEVPGQLDNGDKGEQ